VKNELVRRILAFLEKRSRLENDAEKEKVKYILSVIIGECGKISFLLIMFTIFNRCKEYVFAAIAVLITRSFAGGPHEKTSNRCMAHTFLFFAAVILFSEYHWNEVDCDVVILIVVGSFLLFAPIVSKTRGYCSKSKRMKLKRNSIFGVAFVKILMEVVPLYKNVMMVALFMELIEFYYLLLKERSSKKCGE